MKDKLLRLYSFFAITMATVLTLCLPVLASNPLTGDERGQKMWIFILLLVVSVVLIAVFVATGKKGKKK